MAEFPHPVARILLWCGWAVAVERAAMPQFAFLAVATATAFLFYPVRSEGWRLLRRTRWLMAVLLLTYAASHGSVTPLPVGVAPSPAHSRSSKNRE